MSSKGPSCPVDSIPDPAQDKALTEDELKKKLDFVTEQIRNVLEKFMTYFHRFAVVHLFL